MNLQIIDSTPLTDNVISLDIVGYVNVGKEHPKQQSWRVSIGENSDLTYWAGVKHTHAPVYFNQDVKLACLDFIYKLDFWITN